MAEDLVGLTVAGDYLYPLQPQPGPWNAPAEPAPGPWTVLEVLDHRRHFRASSAGLWWLLRKRYPQRCAGNNTLELAHGYVACMRCWRDADGPLRWVLFFR